MSMNTVIRQVINLDIRASEIKGSAMAKANQIEMEAREIVKNRESEVMSKAKDDNAKNYQVEIAKAETEKEQTIADMEQQLQAFREQYERNKTENARQVLEYLLKTV
jgi:hypothetical protein